MIRHWLAATLLLGTIALLGACADQSTKAAEQARIDAKDNQDCLDLGFKPGNDAYGNCRLKLKEIRAQMVPQPTSPQIGIGLGFGFGH